MKAFHMVVDHNSAPYLDIITIKIMLSLGFNSNNSSSSIGTIEENIRVQKMTQSFEDKKLQFMG